MCAVSPVQNLPQKRNERWDALSVLISQWYRPLSSQDGVAAKELDLAEASLGIKLPIALREWYELAGNRQDVWCVQDELVAPALLKIRDGVLVFYVENQSVVRWGIPEESLRLDDPPAVIESMDQSNHWIQENGQLSEFAVQMALFTVKFSPESRCWANGSANPDAFELIAEHYPRFSFPEWYWLGDCRTKFYGSRDIVIETNGRSDWIWLTTRTETAYRDFCDLILPTGIRWEASSDE